MHKLHGLEKSLQIWFDIKQNFRNMILKNIQKICKTVFLSKN